jgi:hypothetical protein
MKIIQFWKAGYYYLCEFYRPKNTHLPGSNTVLYKADNMPEMKEFREMKGI